MNASGKILRALAPAERVPGALEQAEKGKLSMRLKVSLSLILGWGLAFSSSPAFSLPASHPILQYEKGKALLDQYRGDPETLDRAETIFRTLVNKFPQSPFGYLGMSRSTIYRAYRFGSHFNMNLIRNKALPMAVRALELGPSIREVHDNYAAFEQIFEQFSLNQRRTQQMLALFPNSAATYYEVAEFIRDLEEYERAADYYTIALEFDPSPDLEFKILTHLAHLYLYELKQLSKAVESYKRAMALREGPDFDLLASIGEAYARMGEYAAAVENYEKALALREDDRVRAQLLRARAQMFVEQNQAQAAIDEYERLLSLRPFSSEVHLSLGQLYFQKKQYDRAYAHLRTAIDLGVRESRAFFLAGRSADSLGEDDQALGYYRRYLSLDQTSQDAEWIRAHKPEISMP